MVQNAGEKTEVLASLEQTYDSELNDSFIVTFEPELGVKVGETGWGAASQLFMALWRLPDSDPVN